MSKILMGILGIGLGSYIGFLLVGGNNSFVDSIKIKGAQLIPKNVLVKGINAPENLSSIIQNNNKMSLHLKSGSDAQKMVLKTIQKDLNTLSDCINKETCLSNPQDRFYNKSMDPVFSRVLGALQHLDNLSDEEPRVLENISNEILLSFMGFENEMVFHLVNVLLYKKGEESILESEKTAMKMETKLINEYLINLSKSNFIKSRRVRDMRNNIISSHLKSRDISKLTYTLKSLNHIHFEIGEVERIQKDYCRLEIQVRTEPQKVLRNKFATFFKKYQLREGC
ncbi:MAG: hypothetical protein ACJAS4_001074 [Bacteriovoracaceae bacterium]|jgi:hypothetical protein